jgi:hypothetical protein
MRRKSRQPSAAMLQFTGEDVFVIRDGVKIAQRGHPETKEAGKWISLEPGWAVLDGPDLNTIIVTYRGVVVQY